MYIHIVLSLYICTYVLDNLPKRNHCQNDPYALVYEAKNRTVENPLASCKLIINMYISRVETQKWAIPFTTTLHS